MVFSDYSDNEPVKVYTKEIEQFDDYLPGQFFRRELPCILSILDEIDEEMDTLIIDGYVDLGLKPGLGRHLWDALSGKKIVIGVAKSLYKGADAVKVFLGKSNRPLYITSAGIDVLTAASFISSMKGDSRIPGLIKMADTVSKGKGHYITDFS